MALDFTHLDAIPSDLTANEGDWPVFTVSLPPKMAQWLIDEGKRTGLGAAVMAYVFLRASFPGRGQ